MDNQQNDTTADGHASALAAAPGSAAWLRGADAAYQEEQFFEKPRNPYKPGTKRARDWTAGYQQWSSPNGSDEPRGGKS